MRIAAICAYTRSLNTGMLSVDSAISSFIARNLPSAQLDFYTIEGESSFAGPRRRQKYFPYGLLTRYDQLTSYDRILYWGDFLHSRRFHVEHILPRARVRYPEVSETDFLDRIFSGLLLEGAPDDLLSKVVCFGGSVYFDSPTHAAESRYKAALQRLYSNARLVLVRDPISAALIPNFGATPPHLGVDCSFLLKPFALLNWEKISASKTSGGKLGYSFNRRVARDKRRLDVALRFVHRLAEAMEIEPVDIQWLQADPDQPLTGLSKKLSTINRCEVVVTDTYHCAINALREGVRPICIGIGSEHAGDPLSEKKKELMFNMFNANAFYLFFETIVRVGAAAAAASMAEIVRDEELLALVKENIRGASQLCEQRLLGALGTEA